MSVWYCIPSARPPAEAQRCVDTWRAMGYKVALWRDAEDGVDCDLFMVGGGEYPGYAVAVNSLVREVLKREPECDWCVTGGDDVFPDPNKRAGVIAAECGRHFWGIYPYDVNRRDVGTLGVMQPTGDGHGIETICGSPWIGREFAERAYGGNGPFYEGYRHCFLDNELQDVAKMLGCFWQRPDLTHRHEHWSWSGKPMPEFLRDANSAAHWAKYQGLYLSRKAAGFPGHELLQAVSA